MRKLFPRRSSNAMVNTPWIQERRSRPRKGTQWHTYWFLFGTIMMAIMVFWLISAHMNLMNAMEDSSGRVSISGNGDPKKPRQFGSALRFRPSHILKRMEEGRRRIDEMRSDERLGIRAPRLAFVVGSMIKDSQSLLLLTMGRSLRELGYVLSVFALEDGEAHTLWENIDCHVSVLGSDHSILIDWTSFEGVLLSSLEAKKVISSLMQVPFNSVPLIWLIQDDGLTKRLSSYVALQMDDLIIEWRSAFRRADVVVFSDFTLPMMYASLDAGNFYVIPGSPVDVWAAQRYISSHSKHALRENYGFGDDDLIITVIGSHSFYADTVWSYAASILLPQFMKITRIKDLRGKLKFIFLCGNTTDSYGSDFEEIASRMGFPPNSIKHYGMGDDVNGVIMIADIVLYGSFQEEQAFPLLVVRAMSFQIPIIVPDFPTITKYVNDKVHGLVFHPHDIDSLARALLLLIEDSRLSTLARSIAYEGRSYAKNMFASNCIIDFANLFESMLQFPSDSFLPESVSQIKQQTWSWDLLDNENDPNNRFEYRGLSKLPAIRRRGIIDILEEEVSGKSQINSLVVNESALLDYPSQLDWDDLSQMEIAEDLERQEMEQIAERMEKDLGSWDDLYRNAKKSENIRFEVNERDEGELERTGQSLCIYEIYNGQGAWPFLHHGSLYRV